MSKELDYRKLEYLVSYDFVGKQGWNSFISMLNFFQGTENYNYWEESFFGDPIKTMKSTILAHIDLEIMKGGKIPLITYVGINPADSMRIGEIERIRTIYRIDDEIKEVVWIFEYGTWKVDDFSLSLLELSSGEKIEPQIEKQPAREQEDAKSEREDSKRKGLEAEKQYKELPRGSILLGVTGTGGIAGAGGDEYELSVYTDKEPV